MLFSHLRLIVLFRIGLECSPLLAFPIFQGAICFSSLQQRIGTEMLSMEIYIIRESVTRGNPSCYLFLFIWGRFRSHLRFDVTPTAGIESKQSCASWIKHAAFAVLMELEPSAAVPVCRCGHLAVWLTFWSTQPSKWDLEKTCNFLNPKHSAQSTFSHATALQLIIPDVTCLSLELNTLERTQQVTTKTAWRLPNYESEISISMLATRTG